MNCIRGKLHTIVVQNAEPRRPDGLRGSDCLLLLERNKIFSGQFSTFLFTRFSKHVYLFLDRFSLETPRRNFSVHTEGAGFLCILFIIYIVALVEIYIPDHEN